MDYHDKNVLMNLNLYFMIKHHPIALWKTGSFNSIVAHSKTSSVKVVQKQFKNIVSENIDALREMIMQDRHVIYRELEASLDISFTYIHSIYTWP